MAVKITKLALNRASQTITVSAEADSSGEYMTTIYIDTQKTFICKNEPSDSATKIALNPDSLTENTNTLTITDGKVTKITNFVIDLTKITQGVISTLDLDKDMMFFFIDDITSDELNYVLNVLFDQEAFYMQLFRGMHKNIVTIGCCDLPQIAADIALMFDAFQLSLLTADFKRAIYYWNELHIGKDISATVKCNCRQ